MTWTDDNGFKYIFDDINNTASVDLSKYNGQENITIPKNVKYNDKEYAIVNVKGNFTNRIKCIDFVDDSLVSSFDDIYAEKIFIPPLVEKIDENSICSSFLQIIEFKKNSNIKYINIYSISLSKLTKIRFPSSVTEIYRDGFFNNELPSPNLTEVEFEPNSNLQKIGEYSFFKSSIKQITIPSSVKEICYSAFENCELLDSIEFHNNSELREIGCGAFTNTNIKKIIIPSSVKEICSSAFRDCKLLESIEFQNNSALEKIGSCIISNTNIKKITIPSSVKEICSSAFNDCKTLEFIDFPNNSELRQIGSFAFSNTNIKQITIPSQVEKLDQFFFGATQLKTIDVSKWNSHYSIVDGLLVYHNERILFGNKNNSTFYIPSNIKEISMNSFKDSENLKEIIFPENSELEIIGKSAFMNSGIAKIKLPTKLQKIESNAFKDCKNLRLLKIPSNCELYLIEDNAFQSSGIEKIDITSCVIQIGSNVFDNCNQLVSISFLNSNLKSIGNCSFQSSSITEIAIPSSVKQIGEFAFNKCDKLKTIIFSKDSDLRYIEQSAFKSVNQLEEIVIPSKVREIGKNAFESCYNLKKVEFLDNSVLTLIDDYAFKGTQIDTLIIGSTVKRIGVSAFEYASMNSIQFKDSQNSDLQLIDKSAFKGCKFTQILIPSSVQIIEDSVFESCSNLKSVKFDENSQLRTLGNSVFSGTKIESIDIPSQVDDIKDLCFKCAENLMSIIPQKENEHYSILTDDKMIYSLILYRKNVKNPVFDELIYVNQYLKSIKIPSDVKYISMNAFKNNHLEYLEFSKGSEVDFIHRNSIDFQNIKTIVAPLSLINEPSFFGYYANIKQIGIIDDGYVKIDKFTFAGFKDVCCVSFPNAETLRIEKGCKKMSIIASEKANIIGDELEIHEIRNVHRKLLEKDRFPSVKKELEFLYQKNP